MYYRAFLLALLAVFLSAPAFAQARVCPKVDVSFKCGDIGGNMKFGCNAGEAEADCCSRIKERLKKRSCKNKDLWFRCSCPQEADGASRLPGPQFPGRPIKPEQRQKGLLTPADPLQRQLPKPDSNRRRLPPVQDPPTGKIDPMEPPKGTLKPKDAPKGTLQFAACRAAVATLVCKNGLTMTDKFRCNGNESTRQCCYRVRMDMARKCRRSGGVARIDCDCGKDPAILRRR